MMNRKKEEEATCGEKKKRKIKKYQKTIANY